MCSMLVLAVHSAPCLALVAHLQRGKGGGLQCGSALWPVHQQADSLAAKERFVYGEACRRGQALWSPRGAHSHQPRRRKDAEKLRQLAESPAASLVPVCSGRSLACGTSAALVPLTAATAQGLVAEDSLTFLGLRPRDGTAVFAGECVERVDALVNGSPAGQARCQTSSSGHVLLTLAECSQRLRVLLHLDTNRRPWRSRAHLALCFAVRTLLHQGVCEPGWLTREALASRRAGWT